MSLDICVSNTSKREVLVRPVSCGRCNRVCLRRLSQCRPTGATNKENILKYPKCQNEQQTIMRRLHHCIELLTIRLMPSSCICCGDRFGRGSGLRIRESPIIRTAPSIARPTFEQTHTHKHTNKVMDQRLSQSTLGIPRMVP